MAKRILDFSNFKVSVAKDKQEIYDRLTQKSGKNIDDRPFATKRDLFLAAACIGAKNNLYEDPKNKVDTVTGNLINEEHYVSVLAALAYKKTEDLEVLGDPRKVLEIAEGYANGGIDVIEEALLEQEGTPLDNLVELIISG